MNEDKRQSLLVDLTEVVKKYDPEVVDTKEFTKSLDNLLDVIEQFETECRQQSDLEKEKYDSISH